MSFQSLGKKSHDGFHHLKKITNMFRSQTRRISRLSAHEIMNDVSSLIRFLSIFFLVACTRLYTPLCPSVRPSVTFTFFINFISLSHFRSFKCIISNSKRKSRTRLKGVGLLSFNLTNPYIHIFWFQG